MKLTMMKAKLLLPLLYSLLLLLATFPAAEGQSPDDFVLDTDGNPLQHGVQYWVRQVYLGPSVGGLMMSLVNDSCPLHVIQENFVGLGQPVMFFPEDKRWDGAIRLSEKIYALFPLPTECPQSTVWKVDDGRYVATGGYVSQADPNYSRFSIIKASGNGYVIQSCPWRSILPCSNVIVSVVNGQRLLSVSSSEDVYPFLFKKMKEDLTNILQEKTVQAEV